MEREEPADYVVATYDEIRLRFGLGGTDHARIKAKRRKWVAEPRNNPGSLARIRVPRAEWDALEVEERSPGTDPPGHGERTPGTDPLEIEQSRKVNPLAGLIAAFRKEQEHLRGDLTEAKALAEKAQAELAAERDAARATATTAMLEASEARLRAAVAETEAKALREALEEARRPFWRRWIG
jgi:hypothetical protein